MKSIIYNGVSPDEAALIVRFMNAFDAIESFLRETLRQDKNISFSQLVRDYLDKYPRLLDQEHKKLMLKIGDLRNVVVHERGVKDEYLSVPAPDIVTFLERIRVEWTAPKKVLPTFGKPVISFQAQAGLLDVLQTIREKDFSQFPVYAENKFLGLLTDNGITHWLSCYSANGETIIGLDDVTAKDLLSQEEQRKNYQFISRDTTLLDAENWFVNNSLLEALLITDKGKPTERLIGIMTRWDVLKN